MATVTGEARTLTSNSLVREKKQAFPDILNQTLFFRGAIEHDKALLPMLVLWEDYPQTVEAEEGGGGRKE